MPNTFAVPANACDCHMHIFGTAKAYPGAPERAYTPLPRTEAQYLRMMRPLGFERIVVVQPSPYGTDNRCIMDAIAADPSHRRGVAVVPLTVAEDELTALAAAGVRGIRFNIVTSGLPAGASTGDVLERAIRLVRPFGGHLQVFAPARQIAEVAAVIRASEVPLVLDHMGGATVEKGVNDPDFRVVLDLLAEGKVWAKLSGADRVLGFDVRGQDHVRDEESLAQAVPFARALIAANPRNLVWGTDWPNVTHPVGGRGADAPQASYRDLDAAQLLAVLRRAVDDEPTWRAILADNPARLYGF